MTVKHLGNQVYTHLTADTKPTTAPSGAIAINTQTGDISIYDGVDWDLINLAAATVADDSITNAKINSAAAIAYSKLNLATSIVNADISASAAIAYSKLSLTGAILNADLAGSIAYSKLSLTGAILNADLAGGITAAKLVQKDGVSTQSGDGTTTTFNIAHGFGSNPTVVFAKEGSNDAIGSFWLTKDATNITVNYIVPPPSGSSNLVWYWRAA